MDHPRVEHRSFISYREAEIVEWSKLQELLRSGELFGDVDCDQELFERICQGVQRSKCIRPAHRAYFEAAQPPLPQAA